MQVLAPMLPQPHRLQRKGRRSTQATQEAHGTDYSRQQHSNNVTVAMRTESACCAYDRSHNFLNQKPWYANRKHHGLHKLMPVCMHVASTQ